MADLSITAASLAFSAAALATRQRAISGAALAQGDIVYVSAGVANLADGDSATAAARVPAGMACNAVAAGGQPVEYIDLDEALTLGSHGLAINTVLVLSRTAGKMMPVADLATGDYGAVLAIVKSATQISFNARQLLQSGAATA
jgi:hypothetical protein